MNENTENAAPAGETIDERTIQQDNRPRPKPPAVIAGAPPRALVPKDMDEAWRVATLLVRSGLSPRDVNTPERAMVAIMTGLELGLPPMTAIQRIAVINGRPCIWGDAVPAIAQRTGMLDAWDEGISGDGDDMTAYCTVRRRVNSESTITKTATFSVADAKKAGLWTTEAKVTRKGRDGGSYVKDNDSPWYRFPKRMLQMRARVAFRDLFADAMCGLYVAEELVGRESDSEMRDVTPPTQPIIHNPLQDDADLDEVPAKQLREDEGAIVRKGDDPGPYPLDTRVGLVNEEGAKALTEHEPDDGAVVHLGGSVTRPGDAGHPTDDEFRNMTEVQAPAAKPPRARKPRQALAEAASEPEPDPVASQPPSEKTSPAPNLALGIAFGKQKEWITRTGEEYEAYLRQWTEAWVAWGHNPNGLRDRWRAERTIRNALSKPMDAPQFDVCKAVAMEAFQKIGGVLQ